MATTADSRNDQRPTCTRWATGLLGALLMGAGIVALPQPATAAPITYYVSPSGKDTNSGITSTKAFKTVQRALTLALPGDTVRLAAGTYLQDITSVRSGTAATPITIIGPSTAIVKGAGRSHVIDITHNYLRLDGFTVDGKFATTNAAASYRNKLIYVQGKGTRSGVTGLTIRNMTVRNAGGECIRLRYFATYNEIANNTIDTCGVVDFQFAGGGKNGEGIYIGTAPEQLADGKNPTTDRDGSHDNWVHHNTIVTRGGECVDVKEAATANLIEHNSCSGARDPSGGGLDARGSGNTFRYNNTFGHLGAGIRLGGDTSTDGTLNDVHGNTIQNNAAGGIKFMATPQASVCGNVMAGNTGGDSVGTYKLNFNPTAPCP